MQKKGNKAVLYRSFECVFGINSNSIVRTFKAAPYAIHLGSIS